MGTGNVRRAGGHRTWTAHPAEQTDPAPHRNLHEYSRDGESASTGEFVNSLLAKPHEYTTTSLNQCRLAPRDRYRARREAQDGHRGAFIWFTGLS